MPKCQHCGSHISEDWKRVMGVEGEVIVCPHCEDRYPAPDSSGVYDEYTNSRTAQSQNGSEPSTFDPAYTTDGGGSDA